jgi:hypothetical protein
MNDFILKIIIVMIVLIVEKVEGAMSCHNRSWLSYYSVTSEKILQYVLFHLGGLLQTNNMYCTVVLEYAVSARKM